MGRHAVRAHRRRLAREQLLAALVLLVLLGVTLALLGVRWLGAGPGTPPSAPPPISDPGGAP